MTISISLCDSPLGKNDQEETCIRSVTEAPNGNEKPPKRQANDPSAHDPSSVVKEVAESFASTTVYRTFQEFSQRAKSLKTLSLDLKVFS